MGSGSSKEKVPKRTKNADQKTSKTGKNDPHITQSSGPTKFEAKNVKTFDDKTLKRKSTPEAEPEKPQIIEKPRTIEKTVPNISSNGHVRKPAPVKNLGKFESDSDSEPEDIAEVLAATRAANNNRVQEQNLYNIRKETEDLPETYAQRLQREQYRHEQQGLMREKTIYRNPDEWDVEEERIEKERFDSRRFKAANPIHNAELDRDIYSPVEAPEQKNVIQRYNVNDPGGYNDHPPSPDVQEKVPEKTYCDNLNLPKYDFSEEALLAEIENEF